MSSPDVPQRRRSAPTRNGARNRRRLGAHRRVRARGIQRSLRHARRWLCHGDTDGFPFTTDEQAFNGERASLLHPYRPEQRPKIVFTNTSVEYWGGGRAAALIHTSADGRTDLMIPDNVRIYFLAGTQHGEAAFPPARTRGQQIDNPVPQREVMRALVKSRYLLPEDVENVVKRGQAQWAFLTGRNATSSR